MKRIHLATVGLVMATLLFVPLLSACGEDTTEGKKVVFGDWGVGPTCLAPFYVALEEGYLAKEGLSVEHRRYPGMKEVYEALSLGEVTFAPVPTHLVNLLEEGFNMKATLAMHPGCMQGIADIRQEIFVVGDLKGKRVGVPGFGGCPHAFTMWELEKAGLDPEKDVEFKAYPPSELLMALKEGKIDAMLVLDPIGQLALNQGIGRLIFSTTYPEHGYSDVPCCILTMNADFIEGDRDAAAAIINGMVAAQRSITGREDEVARMMVDKGYSSGEPATHALLLKSYDYTNPSVQAAKDTLRYYGALYQQVGIIDPATDLDSLAERGFVQLVPEMGVSKVPPPPTLDERQ